MEEESKEVKEDVKEETPPQEVNNSTELIDKANEAAERMERANAKKEVLLQREEALKVEKTLGGEAEVTPDKKEEEESYADYAKKVMANETEMKNEAEAKDT